MAWLRGLLVSIPSYFNRTDSWCLDRYDIPRKMELWPLSHQWWVTEHVYWFLAHDTKISCFYFNWHCVGESCKFGCMGIPAPKYVTITHCNFIHDVAVCIWQRGSAPFDSVWHIWVSIEYPVSRGSAYHVIFHQVSCCVPATMCSHLCMTGGHNMWWIV